MPGPGDSMIPGNQTAGKMPDDYLKDLPPDQVAAWYLRLAQFIEQQNKTVKDPLAPKFLRHWLKGGGKKLVFPAPEHLRQSGYVTDVLKDHRAWYLTEDKFKGRWVGVIPRLQGQPGFAKWRPRDDGSAYDTTVTYPYLDMELQSLVEIPVKILGSLSDGDEDLLTALHGFQLRTSVRVWGYSDGGNEMEVNFADFRAQARDRYDWDPDKHFTVPNPDFRDPFKAPNPVAPYRNTITVYHKNAIRLEKAGKAWPYDLESEMWTITDLKIRGWATIRLDKKL
jgi:hypothetical protein